ncbi:DUF6003 family protein [Streptomyces fulvorobeus]|uniref:Uncharacterized protein n=1 Tax=Streptomyces fulvorobeus TaxID=284028 RepID=A0A7J0CF33_9ACTN|nr:DUF6003 family protein [Streptomyces fulvorobeus]NYE44577.1 hypothetical protein [Streptomyces fulvorobeus]GFN01113.1 hypothetical protein Sfulv_59230 [Streptomyces fulvorobeus]
MDHDARLFLLPDRYPRVGAALGAVGALACTETPAVHGWLQAHGFSAASEEVRILPADAEALIPEDAESLPVPLSEEEASRVHRECAPKPVAELEADLRDFRETTREWEALVHRALTAGIPAPRIAQLTGLSPQEISGLIQSQPSVSADA